MKSNLSSMNVFIVILALAYLFISFTNSKLDDKTYKNEFINKYAVFSIIKPKNVDFAGEKVDVNSNNLWERFDKELLKNTYWQSNTMLYIKRANKYFPIIEPILKKNNIPEDFKYLAVIESGLENVTSPSGAKGFWQFLKSTAKEYNLEVNYAVDERYNLEKSTQAACDYLNEAFEKFNSWTLAAAAYNMGMNGLQKALDNQKVENYYDLHLNSETSRYVFRILAVKEILQNPQKYGFVIRKQDMYFIEKYYVVEIDSTVHNLYEFCENYSINYQQLKKYNPWLLTSKLPDESRKKYFLKIPANASN
ncbi:MAG: murein transglycosylase [Flavobacteriales bacterium]|nr:MAG: murein transglycosylase [Flavobacteriales bacterium]